MGTPEKHYEDGEATTSGVLDAIKGRIEAVLNYLKGFVGLENQSREAEFSKWEALKVGGAMGVHSQYVASGDRSLEFPPVDLTRITPDVKVPVGYRLTSEGFAHEGYDTREVTSRLRDFFNELF